MLLDDAEKEQGASDEWPEMVDGECDSSGEQEESSSDKQSGLHNSQQGN